MALRLNTIEYAFPQLLTGFAAAAVQNFSQITVDIPETTNRTFVGAYADIATLDTIAVTGASPTSWSFGLRVGGTGAFLNQTVTQTLTATGEQQSFHFLFDVSSQFIDNFGSTASNVVDASFSIAVSTTNNTSCKLVITYQWDDTDQTRIKTVRIPIESSTNALGTTLANITGGPYFQIPALNNWLPEASKAYKDIFFESWVNEGTTAVSAPNPSLGFALDSEVVSWDMAHEDGLASARLYRRIWQRKDMTTNVEHEFKANTANTNTPYRGLNAILNVTYTYYEPDTSRVMNSIMIAAADEVGYPGGTTSADISRYKRSLSIPDENVELTRSGVLFSWIDAAGGSITWGIKVGDQSNFTTYVIPGAANNVCGGFMFMHNFDASSRGGQGITLSKIGNFNVDWYTTLATAGRTGSNVSAIMYLNYISDKSTLSGGSANHPHTVIPLLTPHTAGVVMKSINMKLLEIPETDRWIMGMCPVLSYFNAVSGYIYLSAELDSSTNFGAGWTDLYTGMIQADAEIGPQLSYARARKEFRRWPLDTDTDRMYLEKERTFRIGRSVAYPVGCFCPITYHTIIDYVSGQVSGYTGDGAGIDIHVYDTNFLNEMVYETSTAIGGGWGFTWYNASTYFLVGAYQDATHQGTLRSYGDVSLNIAFGGAPVGSATSWVF
jgi:hypothetical protein